MSVSHTIEDNPFTTVQKATESMEKLAEAAKAAGSVLDILNDQFSPRSELKWRLNAQLKGHDPGKPVNWRGL